MQFQGLPPSVQNHQATDLCAQLSGSGGNLQQRLPHGAKQEIVEHSRMCRRHRRQFVRQSEDRMEVLDGKQFLAAGLQPSRPISCLTFRTMPVATRVIDGRLGAAGGTALQMATHHRRATANQCCQDLALLHVQVGSAGGDELGSVPADDFADLERRLALRGAGGETRG
jgi:hypothetical protein